MLANDLIILHSVLTASFSKCKIAVFYCQVLCWMDILPLTLNHSDDLRDEVGIAIVHIP